MAATTSDAGISLIKRFEGLELDAYRDIAGVWTIGYGHTGDAAFDGNVINEDMAEALLREDLETRERLLANWARDKGVTLNANEFDALISFIYNVGYRGFQGSTAARRLVSGDRLGAAEALQWWNKARVGGVLQPVAGLTRRRSAESELFLRSVFVSKEEEATAKDWRGS